MGGSGKQVKAMWKRLGAGMSLKQWARFQAGNCDTAVAYDVRAWLANKGCNR